MHHHLAINEFNNFENNIFKIEFIQFWLLKHSDLYKSTINNHSCSNLTLKLPCMCSNRHKDCLFIEIYTKLKKQIEICNQNSLFQNKIFEYEKNKNNNEKRQIWVAENLHVGLNNLWFFMSPNYPNKKMSFTNGKVNDEFGYLNIEIDGKDFKHIYDYANLFSRLFFEEKLLPNEYAKWKYENEITD